MISIHTKPEANGFSFLFNSFQGMWFHFEYIAISSGGNQLYGQRNGFLEKPDEWTNVSLGMPIIHVGITNISMSISEAELEKASRFEFYSSRLIEKLGEISNIPNTRLPDLKSNPESLSNLLHRLIELEQGSFRNSDAYPYYPYYPYYISK